MPQLDRTVETIAQSFCGMDGETEAQREATQEGSNPPSSVIFSSQLFALFKVSPAQEEQAQVTS